MKGTNTHSGLVKLEIFSAVLMSLATVATAWSAYQATLWGGIQTFMLADAAKSGQVASLKSTEATLRRFFDGVILMEYLGYFLQGQHDMADFYFKRLRPELKVAVESWLAMNPLQNPEAPPHPLAMEEYVVRQIMESKEFEKEAYARRTEAERANKISDNYTMATVLFAIVLFLSGIATKFELLTVRLALLILAAVVFFGSVGVLYTFPVTFD